jgi:O-antigen ligase
MLLSLYNADVPSLVFASFEDFLKDALLALTILLLLTRAQTLRGVVWTMILGGCFLSAINGYQHLIGAYDQNFGGFSRLAVSENIGAPDWIRMTGPMDDPNSYAQILLIVVPLALERLWNEQHLLLRLLALAALVLVINAIMLTYSRGAIVALTVMLVVVLPVMRVRLSWIIGASIIFATFLSLAPSNYTERMRTIVDAFGNADGDQAHVDDAVGGRVAEMQIAWQMFKDHPVLGVGEDHYQDRFQQYSVLLNGPPRGESRKAHSLYLEIAAERGVVGLIVFGVLLFCLGRHFWRAHTTFAKAGQLHYAQMVLALAVGFAGYLAAALFLHESYTHYFWMMVGLALAVPQVAAEGINVAVPGDVAPRPAQRWPDAVSGATLRGRA